MAVQYNQSCCCCCVGVISVEAWCEVHDCVWMHGVFIVWNLLDDMAQLQPWPPSLAYSYEVKDVHVGLNLCSKTVSWADVLFAYSYTAICTSLTFPVLKLGCASEEPKDIIVSPTSVNQGI